MKKTIAKKTKKAKKTQQKTKKAPKKQRPKEPTNAVKKGAERRLWGNSYWPRLVFLVKNFEVSISRDLDSGQLFGEKNLDRPFLARKANNRDFCGNTKDFT